MGEPDGITMSEQRRTRRIKVSVATILEADNLHYFAETGDLSETGILLLTRRDFPIGARMRLAFALPPGLPNVIAEGVVKRSETGKGVGVEFVSLTSESKETLARFLDASPGSSDS